MSPDDPLPTAVRLWRTGSGAGEGLCRDGGLGGVAGRAEGQLGGHRGSSFWADWWSPVLCQGPAASAALAQGAVA